MLKLIKYIFYFFIGTFLFFIVVPIAFVLFLSPEIYKKSLEEMLQKSTGREVSIHGMLHWTIFPQLGISMDNVTLSNPYNFATSSAANMPFLTIAHGQAGIDLSRLSNHDVEINSLVLDGVKLNLIKNSLGQVNWQIKKSDPKPSNIQVKNGEIIYQDKHSFIRFSDVKLTQFHVKNSEINYTDEINKKYYRFNHINLDSQNIILNKSFPVKASFILNTSQISQPININLSADMTIGNNLEKLLLENINAQTNQYQWRGSLEDSLSKQDLTAISGHMTVVGNNGAFNGIDLYYYSDLADALIHKTQPTKQDTHQTPFKQLQALLDIQDGIVSSKSFTIQADKMEASGKGWINLITHQIDYQLSLQRLTQGNEIKPRGPAIPLVITGDFSKPTIRPDWQSFLVGQLSDQIQQKSEVLGQKIDQAIQQGLQSLISN